MADFLSFWSQRLGLKVPQGDSSLHADTTCCNLDMFRKKQELILIVSSENYDGAERGASAILRMPNAILYGTNM